MRKDGSVHDADVRLGLLKQDSKTIGVQIFLRDITEHKKVEKLIRESEVKYRAFFENAEEFIFVLELSKSGLLIIRDVNPSR